MAFSQLMAFISCFSFVLFCQGLDFFQGEAGTLGDGFGIYAQL